MGGAAQEGLDRQLLHAIARLRRLAVGGFETAVDGLITRDVALPLALALSSQPHMSRTLNITPGNTPSRRDPIVLFRREDCRDVLDLQVWELEELGEDVDRRASRALRQVRVVRWLWDHHGSSDAQELIRRLMMGAPEAGGLDITFKGGRIYTLVGSARASSCHSVFIPWLSPPTLEGSLALSSFDGRFVDGSLRESLSRGIGLSDDEAVALLDQIVGMLPATQHEDHVERDIWRSSGAARLTGLAPTSRAAYRLIESLAPADVSTKGWLDIRDGRIRLGNAETAFEQLAMARVVQASRLVHASLIARLWSGVRRGFDSEDLALLDIRFHILQVLSPLIRWAESPATAEELARRNGVDVAIFSAAMKRVHERWSQRLERWTALPSDDDPWPPASRLLDHVVRFISVLDSLVERMPLALPHADVVLLYAAHQIAGAADFDLMPLDPNAPGIPEAMATEFWGAWKALVGTTREEESWNLNS